MSDQRFAVKVPSNVKSALPGVDGLIGGKAHGQAQADCPARQLLEAELLRIIKPDLLSTESMNLCFL